MSAGCLRWLLCRAVSHGVRVVGPGSGRPASRFLLVFSESYNNKAPSWRWSSSFSVTPGDSEQNPVLLKKKKQQQLDPRHCQLRVIGNTGENLGIMQRADALRLAEERALKLVVVSEKADPPVYRLVSGKGIHEEQMKQREKQKDKARSAQVKELNLSSDIGARDLRTKLKQVQSWLERKHRVKITLKSRRGEITQSLDTSLEQIVQQIEATVGFVSKPTVVKDGKAAMCVLRSQPASTSLDSPGQRSEPASTSLNSPGQRSEPASTSLDSPGQRSEPASTSLDSPGQRSEPTSTSLDSPGQRSEPTSTSLDSPGQRSEPTSTSLDSPGQRSEPASTSLDSPTDKTKDSSQQ